mgnify:FL=1
MTRIKLLATTATLALGLSAAGAVAQDRDWMESWDSDGDGVLNQSEWNAGLEDEGVFGNYDMNADGALDDDEWGEDLVDLDGSIDDTFDMDEDAFAEQSYGLYDRNDDGLIDDDELGAFEEDYSEFGDT